MELYHSEITKEILNAAYDVHKELGPGLLETAYEACLEYLLIERGLQVNRQKILPVQFRDINVDAGYRIDLLVEDRVILELKAVETMKDIYLAQLITYLKLSGCKVGFLMNFNVKLLKDGIKRMVF